MAITMRLIVQQMAAARMHEDAIRSLSRRLYAKGSISYPHDSIMIDCGPAWMLYRIQEVMSKSYRNIVCLSTTYKSGGKVK